MYKTDAIEIFGGPSAIARKLGISPQAVSRWGEVIPLLSALKLAKASRGKLKVDLDDYKHGGGYKAHE